MFQKDKTKERGRRKAATEGRVWSPVVLRLELGKNSLSGMEEKLSFRKFHPTLGEQASGTQAEIVQPLVCLTHSTGK